MMKVPENIKAILETAPTSTGCYLMKDASGEVIYVGKAVNLRNRLRSYFHARTQGDGRVWQMVRRIAHIEWIVVGSELEALILEMNLIKEHRPHYNVRMKDDKHYPYIKIHWIDPFPKVTITRQMVKDGSRYYGPYTSVWAVHQTLDVLRRIFPYLSCDRVITGQDERACLYYDIKLCTAPCIGMIDQNAYRQMMENMGDFLQGRSEPVVARLHVEMEKAAEELQFERAAVFRDRINGIEKLIVRQMVVSSEYLDSDVIAMARANGEACMQVFFIRGGKLIGREYFLMEGTEASLDEDIISSFLKQFYDKTPVVPEQVLLPNEIEELQVIREWLNTKRGDAKVQIHVPHQGPQQELLKMAAENASATLAALKAQWEVDSHRQEQALAELHRTLGLMNPPNRIECYDISNTQGTAAVGSMVIFEQGVPKKKLYRHFNIRSVSGPDDFASMEEVLKRRFSRWMVAQEQGEVPGKKPDPAFSLLPDLVLIDGGKGQLSRAVNILHHFNLQDRVPVASLAKQQEEIFLPQHANSILLDRNSQGFFLVQRIRDEAHRFAITAHRKRRDKIGIASRLDAVPGIGPVKRKALMAHFGSVAAIQAASIEEIQTVPGINRSLAEALKAYLE